MQDDAPRWRDPYARPRDPMKLLLAGKVRAIKIGEVRRSAPGTNRLQTHRCKFASNEYDRFKTCVTCGAIAAIR